ncbi:alpha/beta hydrolase [Streptomyces vilmorinianum]|uniref:alpha/beta hydrolase n=1 Tax=Streptomyces vilmorinianum TaxID=3051092 RepID=UPI0010FB937B|nr:alpha/beta hydrolase [Streptomyces vilmorinianum]
MNDRLDPAARPFVDLLTAVFPDIGGAVTDPVEARRVLAAAPAPPGEPPAVGRVEDRTVPGPRGAPPVPVRIYRPEGDPAPRPTVVFLHGGGWVLCGLDTHDRTCRALCRESGAVVVSVGYRLAPEARFPAPVEDAYAALLWAAAHIDALGGEPTALVVAGDSAGGNLAAAAALLARDRGGPALARQVLIYPATDLAGDPASYRTNGRGYYLTTAHMRWYRDHYLGPDGDPRHPLASPLRAELAGLPPAHVITAGCDPLCDEGRAFAAALAEAGVAVTEDHHPRMFHGFLALAEYLGDAARALRGAADAIASTGPDRKIHGDHGGGAG